MTKLVEGVQAVVRGLNRKDRKELVYGLFRAGVLTEDEQDRMVLESRRRDWTRPLNDLVKEFKRKGRLQ